MIHLRLALSQAICPEATHTLRDSRGHFRPTPDLRWKGRLLLALFAIANAIAAIVALYPH